MKSYDQYLKTAVAILLLARVAISQEPNGSGQAGVDYVPGEIIILLRSASESQVRLERSPTTGVRMGVASLDLLNTQKKVTRIRESAAREVSTLADRRYLLSVPEGQELNLVRAYSSNEHVEIAGLNHIYRTALTPDDTDWSDQWNFNDDHLQAEKAWDIHTGSPNVVVGVLDTGIDYLHPDLAPNMWSDASAGLTWGRDFCGSGSSGRCSFSPDNDPQHVGGMTYSHGTKMAGVIAARSNNAMNIAGLAGGWNTQPGVQLMALRVGYDHSDGSGGSVYNWIADNAIDWAMGTTTGPIVFNMSWGGSCSIAAIAAGSCPSPTLQASINNAWSTGRAVFVGAALGRNSDDTQYPAGMANVIGVTGVLQNDRKGANTGYGSYVDVSAPVDGVPTVAYNANYATDSDPTTDPHIPWSTVGSTPSISAAQVSGLAALVWSKYPELTNEGVVHQILSTVDNIRDANLELDGTNTAWSGQIGGRINAYRALTEWSGPLLVEAGQTLTWSGSILVTGDVTIPDNTTLTLDNNTTVEFADDTELIVADGGTLTATAGNITFRSTHDDPMGPEWDGIRVESGGSATLTNVAIRDGMHCVQAEEGGSLTQTNVDLENCGTPPVISGPLGPEFPEDSRAAATAAIYRASDGEGDTVRWSLVNNDNDIFELIDVADGGVELRFHNTNPAPDFEAAGSNHTYDVTVQAEDSQEAVAQLVVTVTVTNVEEEGEVLLAGTLPPEVGEQISASLMDPDGAVLATASWQWKRRRLPGTMWDNITSTGATAAAYSPVAGDVGFELQATVGYTDGHNSGKSAASDVTAVVVGGPGDPRELEPVVGAGQVTLTWQEPSSTGGLPILRYEYQRSDDGGQMWPAEGEDTDVDCQAATCSQDLALAPGLYAFGVRAVNAVGFSDWVRTGPIRISALMVASQGSNPELAFAEVVAGQTRSLVVETYTASGVADGTTVGWSLAGADVGVFAISGGVLRFATAPDYEMPTDAGHATDEDGNNVYHVTVQAMAGEQTATLEVEVEVTNQDDPGVVTLSSTQPEVDEPIRATLTDQDGSVEHVRWSWLYFSSEDGSRNGEPTVVASSDELIPSGVLMGLRLQARALYDDEFGTHSAESVQTEPVVGRPSAPQNLTATPSDGSLVLAWDAPSLAGYPAFSGYRYRYKTTKGTAWQPSATGALVDQTTRPTLEEGLIHGKEHTIEVWAVNAQGAGPAATTTATPLSPDTPGRVELTSRRPRVGVPLTATLVDPDAPVRVRRWRWLQSPWYHRSAGDLSLVAPSEARYPEQASYEPTVSALGRRLRAVVDYTDQYGTPSAQSAWTAPVQPGWPGPPELSYVAGDEQVALT